MKKKILVVAAHPDDEVLGCGATVARKVKEGYEAYTLILGGCTTSGEGERGGSVPPARMKEIRSQADKANKVIGVKEVYRSDIPDNRFDKVALLDIVKVVEGHIKKIKPALIYTHFTGDMNVDHRMTARAVLTAARPVPGCSVEAIYLFEVLSSTEWGVPGDDAFRPDSFVDVSSFLEKKIEAMKAYATEINEPPHPRSLEGIRTLAGYRGGVVGKKYCEAFVTARSVE